jgi:hypothetical protein
MKDGEIGQPDNFSEKYEIYRKDRSDGYGGVLVAVTKDILSCRENDLETECEMVWVKVDLKGSKTLHICGYYRPHLEDEQSHESFKESVNRLNGNNSHIWIAGDFNYPGADWKDKTLKPGCKLPGLHQDFMNFLDDQGLEQLVQEPTRGENTLDLCITNNPTNINRTNVIPGISDHEAVTLEGDLTPIKYNQKKRQIPLYKKANWEGLRKHMSDFQKTWTREYTDSQSTNTLWESFKTSLQEGIKQNIPHKTAKAKDGNPWITREIKRLIRKRDKLYTRKKTTKTRKDQESFKHLKALVQKKIRQAYWKYIEDIVTPCPDEPTGTCTKRFWTYIKHCKKDKSGIAPLKDATGSIKSDNSDKATILNQQFCSVFSKPTPLSLKHQCSKKIRETHKEETPEDIRSPYPTMPDINISEAGVAKLLKNLKPHKAAGPDQLTPRVLKEIGEVLAPILATIFTRTLETGKLPDDWKDANVIPIYKKTHTCKLQTSISHLHHQQNHGTHNSL